MESLLLMVTYTSSIALIQVQWQDCAKRAGY